MFNVLCDRVHKYFNRGNLVDLLFIITGNIKADLLFGSFTPPASL